MSTPKCVNFPHGRQLAEDARCRICHGENVSRTCACCGATCLVPPCGTLHSGATPPKICVPAVGSPWDGDQHLYCDDCACDCPPAPATEPQIQPAVPESAVEQLGLF